MTAAARHEQRASPAAGSSFYTAMRILPRAGREAMYAVYAFCRSVDDVADSDTPRENRIRELERWRADVDALFTEDCPKRLLSLAAPVRTFGLPRQEFHAIIDGMMMDAVGDLRAPEWAMLDLYCDRVASAVGRLSVRIFGLDREHGEALAHHLGRALQLTNILRDLDEDADLGRLYLPCEVLSATGMTEFTPDRVLDHPRLDEACREVAARAIVHFHAAEQIMLNCPRAQVRAPRLMAAAYRTILSELLSRGWNPPRGPVHVGRLRLAAAVLRFGVI